MTIRRFQEFLSKNEDTILDECGFPTASQILDVLPFYKANDKLAFVFVEEEDVVWKVSLDAFSFTVYDNSIINKPLLVSVIEGMDFAILLEKIRVILSTAYLNLLILTSM